MHLQPPERACGGCITDTDRHTHTMAKVQQQATGCADVGHENHSSVVPTSFASHKGTLRPQVGVSDTPLWCTLWIQPRVE
jgi:hypothetical protein